MNIKGENMKNLVHFHITEQGWAEIVDAKDNQDAKEKGIEMINKRLENQGFEFFTNVANITTVPAENYRKAKNET